MKRRLITLALVLVVGGVFVSSCEKEEPLSSKKEILSFIFEASENAELDHNIIGTISGTSVSVNVPFGTSVSNLIPSIEVSPKAQLSPSMGSPTDYSTPVSYTVTAEDGSTQEFISTVGLDPAPFLGKWISSTIDFGLGLMHIEITMNAEGQFMMELNELISGEKNSESFKGVFDPLSKPNMEIQVDVTNKWAGNQWSEFIGTRTIMYKFVASPIMRFFYCYQYPKVDWVFEVDLQKE